uniref:ATP-dependent RNA helicase n=1 Tax=Strongyloides venezuelensis TaxID=75913 RepID=A0A0K0G486_STRVS
MRLIQFSESTKDSIINVFSYCDDGDFTQEIHSTLQQSKIEKLSDLQSHLVPAIMDRKYDVFIESERGTGKKLGYILPIINYISMIQESSECNNSDVPVAVMLMKDMDVCKEVELKISRLYPNVKIGHLFGYSKEIDMINEIYKNCDIIIASIVRFIKVIEDENCSSFKTAISKTTFVVIEESEELAELFWDNYLKFVCCDFLNKKAPEQIRIFSSCGLVDLTPKMFMKKYAQNDYVIMKFQNNVDCPPKESIKPFQIFDASDSHMKENVFGENFQDIVNYPDIIVSQPQHNIIVNNFTNNQHFTSNRSYNRHSYPLMDDGYGQKNYVDFLHPTHIVDTFSNNYYNLYYQEKKRVQQSLNTPLDERKFIPPPYSDPDYFIEEVEENDLDNLSLMDSFTSTGILRKLEVLKINIFDSFTKLLEILQSIFKMDNTFKVITFIRRSEGCKYASYYCRCHGLNSRAVTRVHDIDNTKRNLQFFDATDSSVLFIEDKYKTSMIRNLRAHVVITLNLPDTEDDFEEKIRYLGDVNGNGGLFIIMGTRDTIRKEWLKRRMNCMERGIF